MSIIRRKYTANFTTIGNELFDDERLSADEVGILAYLRSRPADWEVRRPALAHRWNMGREAIKRVLVNLIKAGWCRAEKARKPDGTYYTIYEIRDEPGPALTDEEVRRALSLVSSEAAQDQIEGVRTVPERPENVGDPDTGYPHLADPSPADPPLAYKDIPNKELPRKDATQNPEREGAREREKHAKHLAEFKRRYPTAVSDDQVKIDNAWAALSDAEGDAAIKGIAPFLDRLKRDGRKHPPAAWNYLLQKRWVLLGDDGEPAKVPTLHARDSVEARALAMLYRIAGAGSFFHSVMSRGGGVSYSKAIEPKVLKLVDAPPEHTWPELDRQQAAAWEAMLREFVTVQVRKHLVAGDRAPWSWPPRKDGTLSTAGPETLMSEQDLADFK